MGSTVGDCDSTQVGPVAREEPPTPGGCAPCICRHICPPASQLVGAAWARALSAWSQRRPIELLWAPAPCPAHQPCELLLQRPPACPSSEGRAGPGKLGQSKAGQGPHRTRACTLRGQGLRIPTQPGPGEPGTPVPTRACVRSCVCALPLQLTASAQGSGRPRPHRRPHLLAKGHLWPCRL